MSPPMVSNIMRQARQKLHCGYQTVIGSLSLEIWHQNPMTFPSKFYQSPPPTPRLSVQQSTWFLA